MERYMRFLLRHRFAVLGFVLLSLVVSAWAARDVRIRFQYKDFYTYKDNPQLSPFDAYHRDFGDPGGHVVVYIQSDDIFDRPVLELIRGLTLQLQREKHFVRIRSLATVSVPRGSKDGVATGAIMPTVPDSAEERAALKVFATSNPLLARRLVSSDGKAAAILAEMATPAETATVEEQRQALSIVERALKEAQIPQGVQVDITGAPRVEAATTHALLTDQFVLVPGVLGMLVLVLFLIFRSLHGVLLPMISVSLALGWTAGVFGLLGRNVDIIGSIIPTTLLVYGVVDPIFVMTRYLRRRIDGLTREDAIVSSMTELALPCLLTSVTTAIGFGAFAFATLPTVASYGTTVAVGVAFVWISTITVLPILLSLFPEPRLNDAALRATQSVADCFRVLCERVTASARKIILAAVALLLVGGYYAQKQHISNEYVGSLPRGEVHDVVRKLERDLSGVVRTVVYLEGEPASMKRVEVLQAMERVEKFLERQPEVTSAVSIAELVAEANHAFNEGDPAERKVPASSFLAAQYLTLIAPVDRADLVTDDYSRGIVLALTEDRGSERMRSLRAELRREVDSAFQGLGVKATLTGNSVVAWTALDAIVGEVMIGFAVAFGIVLLLVLLVFRSVRLTLAIVLPNLIPAVVCFATIRILGLNLRLDNSVVMCVAIGGLFNTTIHLASHLWFGLSKGLAPKSALAEAVAEVAPPSLVTTVILSAGFAVLLGSSFRGMQELGILTMVTVLAAFIADMIVTPAVIQEWVLSGNRQRELPPEGSGSAPGLDVGAVVPAAKEH